LQEEHDVGFTSLVFELAGLLQEIIGGILEVVRRNTEILGATDVLLRIILPESVVSGCKLHARQGDVEYEFLEMWGHQSPSVLKPECIVEVLECKKLSSWGLELA
jgi:hypothetical protein